MTSDPDATHDGSTPARGRAMAREESYTWPPSATVVWAFMVGAFLLGGPLTWWAVSR